MKETTRASIGGFAFNIDIDAHEALKKYLNELSEHYKGKEDGDEIISDIEARMSELLRMKLTYPERIVILRDAEEIIATMGRPHQLFDDAYESSENENKKEEAYKINNTTTPPRNSTDWRKRRLFRDVDHKVIGGVCSGLGHYFKIDPVLIRIGFALLLILTNSLSPNLSLSMVAIYLIFLIAMPKAKTMSEKIVMTGTNPTVQGIANRENLQELKTRGSSFVKILGLICKVIIGSISLLIGLSLLISAFVIIFGLAADTTIAALVFALPYFGFGITELSTPLLIFLFTLSIIFIHFGIKVIFSRLKTVDLIVIGVAFIISISSLVYLLSTIKNEVMNYRKHAIETESIAINDSIKTLKISLGSEYLDFKKISTDMSWYRSEENNQWFSAPSIVIETDTNRLRTEVSIEKKFYAKNRQLARQLAKEGHLKYEIKGDSLLILPEFRGEKTQWDRNFFKIIVKPARGVKIEANRPLKTYNTSDYRLNRDLGQPFHEENFSFKIELFE